MRKIFAPVQLHLFRGGAWYTPHDLDFVNNPLILKIWYRFQNNALRDENIVLRSEKEELFKKIEELKGGTDEEQEP